MRDPAQIESGRRALRSLLTRRDTPEQRYRESDGAAYEEPLVQRDEPGLFDHLQSINEPMHPLTKLSIALLVLILSGALGGALVQLLVILIRWSEVPHG